MALTINTNFASLNAQQSITGAQQKLTKALQSLSSGLRINTAADDAAGLGISEKFRGYLSSTTQASQNANDGISATQIADGAMDQQAGILDRLKELATQAANGTNGPTELNAINTEAQQLVSEVNRISQVTEFNGQNLLASGTSINLQVGVHATANDQLAVNFAKTDATTLGVNSAAVNLSTQAGAQAALGNIDNGIQALSSARAVVGAQQNRLGNAISNLAQSYVNVSAANSRIRDADFADVTARLTAYQIQNQGAIATAGQANGLSAGALSLLGGR